MRRWALANMARQPRSARAAVRSLCARAAVSSCVRDCATADARARSAVRVRRVAASPSAACSAAASSASSSSSCQTLKSAGMRTAEAGGDANVKADSGARAGVGSALRSGVGSGSATSGQPQNCTFSAPCASRVGVGLAPRSCGCALSEPSGVRAAERGGDGGGESGSRCGCGPSSHSSAACATAAPSEACRRSSERMRSVVAAPGDLNAGDSAPVQGGSRAPLCSEETNSEEASDSGRSALQPRAAGDSDACRRSGGLGDRSAVRHRGAGGGGACMLHVTAASSKHALTQAARLKNESGAFASAAFFSTVEAARTLGGARAPQPCRTRMRTCRTCRLPGPRWFSARWRTRCSARARAWQPRCSRATCSWPPRRSTWSCRWCAAVPPAGLRAALLASVEAQPYHMHR